MQQVRHCSRHITEKWLQHLFYDPHAKRKSAAGASQPDRACQSLVRDFSKAELNFRSARAQLKTDIVAGCTDGYAGSPEEVTACLLAAYIYFILGRELVRDHLPATGRPIHCLQGRSVSNKDKFLASFILFLEWKVRWLLPSPYQQFIPTAHLSDEQRLEKAWRHVAQDTDALQAYHEDAAWFQNPEVWAETRSTYQRYEAMVRTCLAHALRQELKSWTSQTQPNVIPKRLRGEQFVLYNDQIRKRWNHTPYGSQLPLTQWFIPPPLKQRNAAARTSLDSWVHRDRHLIITGEMGAGKTALLHHLALRQPIEMAPIWLPPDAATSLRSLKTEPDIYALALQHIWPQLDPRELQAWIQLLCRTPERFIILDALTLPSQRVLALLQGMGRVLMALPIQSFDANRLPDPQTWDIIEIDAWSPERLTCAIEKHQPARQIDLTEVATYLEQGFPPYPGWIMPLTRTAVVGEVERYHALRQMMQEKLTGRGSSLAGELRRLAWELQQNPNQTCTQPTGAYDPPADQAAYLGDKLCQKAIPWACKLGFLQITSNNIPAFAHPDMRLFLAAEYVARQYWLQQNKEQDILVQATPHILSGTENAGDLLSMIILADLRHNEGRHLPHFVEGLRQQYITPPRYDASLDLFLEIAQPVGLLKRLLLQRDFTASWHLSDATSQVVKQMYGRLEDALWHWSASLFSQKTPLAHLKTFGLAVTALEPLNPALTDFIASQVLDHPHVLQEPHIRYLLSPQIKRALDKSFLTGVDAHRWSPKEQETWFNLLLQHQVLSPDTMQYLMKTRSAGFIAALAQRGGAVAADALAALWQSPRVPHDAVFFDIVLAKWRGSAIRLFRLLESLQFYLRSLHRPVWKAYLRAFLLQYWDSDELFCILRQLSRLSPPFANFILQELTSYEMGNAAIALALAEVLKRYAGSEAAPLDQHAVKANGEATLDNAKPDAFDLTTEVRRALYTDDIIGDAVLFHLPAEDLLFLFQFDQLPPEEPWPIARQVIEVQLEFLPAQEEEQELAQERYRTRVRHWAEYMLAKIPDNPALLATAILLAPCHSPVLDMWWSDHPDALVREAMHRRWEKCQ